MTLAEARETAIDNKRIVRAGGDPIAESGKGKSALTFKEAALKTHAEIAPTLENPKDRTAFLASFETYVFPAFGTVLLSEVTSADVREVILATRKVAPGIARKLTYRISFVFKWGIAAGMCVSNPSTAEALALPRDTHVPKNRKSVPYSEVATFLATVQASRAWVATKQFLVLTASRSGEVRNAKWDEVDFDANTSTVPAERAKQNRPHRVPLSQRAVEILIEAKELEDGTGLLFPSVRGKALSDMTFSKLVRDLGFDAHVHGFRTSSRTWKIRLDFCRERGISAATQ